MVRKSILLLIFLLICNFSAFTQLAEEFNFIIKSNPIIFIEGKKHFPLTLEEISEVKLVCLGLIRAYQLFISSQQNNLEICTFTPSCSRFGMSAIKKYGVFYGILMTSDRLQRCYGLNRKYYPIHPKTGKCYDPIEPHYLKIKLK